MGGDLVNQLATLVLRTIYELTKQSPHAMFADAAVLHRSQVTPVQKSITTDTLMGSFRTLLEQGLRKYEGKPGDPLEAMLGGILESLPNRAEFVNRLFEWVVQKITEQRKATKCYFADPRDGYSPLPILEDLVGTKKVAKGKKSPQPFEKGKRSHHKDASCRICNITHEGRCK